MKTVLVVAGKLSIGGAERVCRNIGYFANPEKFQIDYLVFGDELGAYEPELQKKGCRIWHMKLPQDNYPRFYTSLKKLIRQQHYDVVHCHTMFNSGLVLHAAKSCGVPIRIAHSHSTRSEGHRSLAQRAYETHMRHWIQRDATHWIGCGDAAGRWLFGDRFFRIHGQVLLNGIDLDRFRFDTNARQAIRIANGWTDRFLIGHVGHLASVKNQRFLLQLMKPLLTLRPETQLLLLGEGADRPMLEAEIRAQGLQASVSMPGNVSDVYNYLSAMDLFVFPSLHEGMPLSVVEAQANGLPCLLSDQVPKDVALTELVSFLPLNEGPDPWVRAILRSERSKPERYATQLQALGLEQANMLDMLYHIYCGDSL